jgi:UDP:flavonoid glycosyltransferase YjiC (YdhE family)
VNSRILFIPYPETGHMNPSFKLAKALKARGHEVGYVSLLDWEERVRGERLDFIPLFEEACPRGFIREHSISLQVETVLAIIYRVASLNHGDPAAYVSREVEKVLGAARPDLILVDFNLADVAVIIARLKLPTILLNVLLQNPWETIKPEYEPLTRMPELILCPEEFDFPPSARPRVHPGGRFYAEASVDLERPEPPFDWGRIPERKELLFCSLGSQSHLIKESKNFFQTVLEAVSALPEWYLILAAGSHLDASDFAPLPPNALVVKSAPQLAVLRRASAMITHGGIGSVKECIFFGVPMIVFPAMRDQPLVAARVVYHKLGVKGNLRDVSVANVRALLAAVSAPLIKSRVDSLSRTFREIEGAGRGVQFVEHVLERLSAGGAGASRGAETSPDARA